MAMDFYEIISVDLKELHPEYRKDCYKQGLGAGASRSRVFWLLGAGARKTEPLEKKPGAGAGAAWKNSQPCDKIKSMKLYYSYSSLGKIVSFYG